METVWKYPIPIRDVFELRLPIDSEVLAVANQGPDDGDHVYLWVRLNPEAAPSLLPHRFRLAGTGDPLDGDIGRHIGTFQLRGGALIFHLFEAFA